jgi:hypothetical protein
VEEVLIDSYGTTNYNYEFQLSGQPGGYKQWGQSFVGSNMQITSCKFYLSRVGLAPAPQYNLTYHCRAAIYNHQGIYGSTSAPLNNTPIALSLPRIVGVYGDDAGIIGLSTGYKLETFYFPSPVILKAGTNYILSFIFDDIVYMGGGWINIGANFGAPTHSGNAYSWASGTIYTPSGNSIDLVFYLYGTSFGWGTYSGDYSPFMPVNILPEPTDPITWDWMEAVSQWSQRFNKMVSYDDVFVDAYGTYQLNYATLNCDHFPPVIKVYERYNGTLATIVESDYEINGISLATAQFYNIRATEGTFLFRIYM